jgi:hypothetical protein
MLESFAVKEILRLLLIFVAVLILVSTLFAALGLLGVLGREYAAKSVPSLSMVLARLPALLLDKLPLTLCTSLLLLLARSGLHPGRSLGAFVVVTAAAFSVLTFLFPLLEAAVPEGEQSRERILSSLLSPGYWRSDGERAYYVESVEEGRFRSLLVVTPDESRARFRYIPAGSTADVPGPAGPGRAAEPAAAFTPEGFAAQLDHELDLLNRELSRASRASRPRYLLFCFAVVFAFMAAIFLMRLSRWPLLNLFLSFLALRCIFYLFRLLREVAASELESLISNQDVMAALPVIGLLVFSGLLLLLHLLFLPVRRGFGGGTA